MRTLHEAKSALSKAIQVLERMLPNGNAVNNSNLGRVHGQLSGFREDIETGSMADEEVLSVIQYCNAILEAAQAPEEDCIQAIREVEDQFENFLKAILQSSAKE